MFFSRRFLFFCIICAIYWYFRYGMNCTLGICFFVRARGIIWASQKFSVLAFSADQKATTLRTALWLRHYGSMRNGIVAFWKVRTTHKVFVTSFILSHHKITGLASRTGDPLLGSILCRTIRYEYGFWGFKLFEKFRGLLLIDHHIAAILGSCKSNIKKSPFFCILKGIRRT